VGIYQKYVIPPLLDATMRVRPVMRQRAKVVPLAHGRVLEVGIGTGLNLSFYDKTKVDTLIGLDPSPELQVLARKRAAEAGIDVDWRTLSSEKIPLDDASIDSIVVTYTLCTIPDIHAALLEMRRVLKSNGAIYYSEHGLAPDESVSKWQNRLNPIWKVIAGGCNLNRKIPTLLENAGFRVDDLQTIYLPGLRPLMFNYWGTATLA